jgi:MFS family permease
MFSSLKIRDFRIFWSSMFLSLIGTWVQSMAQSWLVFKLTNSAFLLGVVGFLSYLPVSLFSLAAGALVDRTVKRNLILTTQITFMALAFILAFLVQHNIVRVWHIIVIAFFNGLVFSFDAPARQAMVFELVGKNHLLNAIALNSAAFNSARTLGPALAGVLIAVVGMAGCFYVNAFSFLPVIAALVFIKHKSFITNAKNNTFFQDITEGLNFIKGNRFLLFLLSLVGMVSIFGVAYVILMPIFAQEILRSGPAGLAILMSANGLGALAGALNLARLKQAESNLKILKASVIIFFVSVMLFSLSRYLWLSALLLVMAGYGGASSMSMANTLLQISAPNEFRGRLMGVFMMMFSGLMPFGNLVSGSLAHFFGAPIVTFGGAGLTLLIFLLLGKRFLNEKFIHS